MASPAPSPDVVADLPALLRRLLQQYSAGDKAGQLGTLGQIGLQRLAAEGTLVGALCLGGTEFAARLVAYSHPKMTQAGCHATVLDAMQAVLATPDDAPANHESQVAEQLIATFGLQVPAAALFDILRADLLITAGPLEEVPEAALAAIRHSQWALALRGFIRCQQGMTHRTPPNVYGLAAMCLHKLGQYQEAERWVKHGLGERQRALIAIGPIRTEAELLQRWPQGGSPVVSIVCTTYNHERYVDDTIRGFLSQDCPFPFEILIHDDASTDGTQQVIRQWQARYPTLIKAVLQTENQLSKGVRPFELLLAQAAGQFVATCEGDDFWIDPNKLQRQVGFLQQNPEFSCSAHNYYHFIETSLEVKPWLKKRVDHVLTEQQLMGLHRLLWIPTLVFRKTFSALPPERSLSPIGDQFLTSYLGTQGRCMYFASVFGAVRRENEFSIWSPLSSTAKDRVRVKTWEALIVMHQNMGNAEAVAALRKKITESPLGRQEPAPDAEAQATSPIPSPHPQPAAH